MYYVCSMNLEKTKAQMRKGVLELCILSIISEKDAYASDIINKLKDSKLIVVEGTLYPLLTRLKNDGLTTYRWEESKEGPPRKYHKITETGMSTLEDLNDNWQEMTKVINAILKKRNKTQ